MRDAGTERPPVLLVGAQRSGTTALAHMLSRAIADRGGVFTVNGKLLYYLRRWWLEPPDFRHARADEIAHALQRRPVGGVGADEWLQRTLRSLDRHATLRADGVVSSDPWSEMRAICREAYATRLWGDKYNEYLLDLDFLRELFPNAHWIFLARHPAHVVASMRNWGPRRPWNPSDDAQCAEKWRVWNQEWLRLRTEIPAVHRTELIYHDLALGRRGRLDDVLGIDLTRYMEEYKARDRDPVDSDLPVEVMATWRSLQECTGEA